MQMGIRCGARYVKGNKKFNAAHQLSILEPDPQSKAVKWNSNIQTKVELNSTCRARLAISTAVRMPRRILNVEDSVLQRNSKHSRMGSSMKNIPTQKGHNLPPTVVIYIYIYIYKEPISRRAFFFVYIVHYQARISLRTNVYSPNTMSCFVSNTQLHCITDISLS